MFKHLFSLCFCGLLIACGGGDPTSVPEPSKNIRVSNALVGSPFIYTDGNWSLPSSWEGQFVVRGTAEDIFFMPTIPGWYTPREGKGETREWWSLTNTPNGILSQVSIIGGQQHRGSFVNDIFTKPVYVSENPVIEMEYQILKISGLKTRITVGVTLQFPNGQYYFLERNLVRTDSWDMCTAENLDRCDPCCTYFPPSSGPVNIRELLLQSPGMTPNKIDSMKLIGVYIGSEIFDTGTVDFLLTSYSVRI